MLQISLPIRMGVSTRAAVFVIGMMFVVPMTVDAKIHRVGVKINVEPSISIRADKSSLKLVFDDFSKGAVSTEEAVTYRIMANHVRRHKHIVLGQLDSEFERIFIETRFASFVNRSGDSRLVPAKKDWIRIDDKKTTGLANKTADRSPGVLIDGDLTLQYRARAHQYLWAKTESRTLTITFVDT